MLDISKDAGDAENKKAYKRRASGAPTKVAQETE
jgi:hypothetical protein